MGLTYDEVVLGRRSIRGYLQKPVPKALIREVIELAMRAPSSMARWLPKTASACKPGCAPIPKPPPRWKRSGG